VNYWLRLIPVVLTLLITIIWLRTLRHRPFLPGRAPAGIVLLVVGILVGGVFGYFDYYALQGVRPGRHPGIPMLSLLPLTEGAHVFINGGNGLDGRGVNDYYQDWLGRKTDGGEKQMYAVDIVKMTSSGFISKGFLPASFLDYYSFNEAVYCPCQGSVIYLEDGHPNVAPFSEGYGLGNRIVLQCADFFVSLSNFKDGTFYVKEGDRVRVGQMLGRVGNSADRTIPHLHMYVTTGEWEGEMKAVPVLFDSLSSLKYNFVFKARNDVYVR